MLQDLKREKGDSCDSSLNIISGVFGHFNENRFYYSLKCCDFDPDYLLLCFLFFLSGLVVKLVWKLNKAIH